jgi:hypothetical protein
MEIDKELQEVFEDYLDEDYSEYAEKALAIFEEIGTVYEIEKIQEGYLQS